MTAAPERNATGPVHLLDGNVLYALIDEAHVHNADARRWFAGLDGDFATCPITQGTLVRLAMRLGGQSAEQALAVLQAVTANARHRYWPDALAYPQIRWHGVFAHRQVTDAYLAALARHNGGKLASFDEELVALHPDVGIAVDANEARV
jgi:uncharacterized protein